MTIRRFSVDIRSESCSKDVDFHYFVTALSDASFGPSDFALTLSASAVLQGSMTQDRQGMVPTTLQTFV